MSYLFIHSYYNELKINHLFLEYCPAKRFPCKIPLIWNQRTADVCIILDAVVYFVSVTMLSTTKNQNMFY